MDTDVTRDKCGDSASESLSLPAQIQNTAKSDSIGDNENTEEKHCEVEKGTCALKKATCQSADDNKLDLCVSAGSRQETETVTAATIPNGNKVVGDSGQSLSESSTASSNRGKSTNFDKY